MKTTTPTLNTVLEERDFVPIEGLNLQFTDGTMLWWRNDRPMNQEKTLFMSDIYLETKFFQWDELSVCDIVFAVRYTATDTKTRQILMREQRVRTKDLRAYDLIIEGPFSAPSESDSRNN